MSENTKTTEIEKNEENATFHLSNVRNQYVSTITGIQYQS